MSPQASSRIELPISRRMWLARVLLVVAFDLGLLAGGIALILAWNARRTAGEAPVAADVRPAAPPAVDPPPSNVELPKPKVLGRRRGGTQRTPVTNASAPPAPPASRPTPAPPEPDPGRPIPAVADAAPAAPPPPPTPAPAAIDAGPAAPVTNVVDGGAAAPPAPGPDPDEEARVERFAEVLRDHITEGRRQIDACYERAAKATTREDPLRGLIEVELTILPSGDARDVHVVQNDTGSEELAGCLVGLLKSWQYPSPGSDEIEFSWPFVFKGR